MHDQDNTIGGETIDELAKTPTKKDEEPKNVDDLTPKNPIELISLICRLFGAASLSQGINFFMVLLVWAN